jgi:hypothetical protein
MERHMTIPRYTRSVPELFTDLIGQVTTLFRKESQLARTEISEKLGQAAGALALIVGGAVLLIPALTILLGAAVTGLTQAGLEAHWAALIVGGGALLLGLVLLLVGVNRLKVRSLVPARTIDQFQQDASVVKQQVRQNDDDAQRAA